jgi:hypothetical protein
MDLFEALARQANVYLAFSRSKEQKDIIMNGVLIGSDVSDRMARAITAANDAVLATACINLEEKSIEMVDDFSSRMKPFALCMRREQARTTFMLHKIFLGRLTIRHPYLAIVIFRQTRL